MKKTHRSTLFRIAQDPEQNTDSISGSENQPPGTGLTEISAGAQTGSRIKTYKRLGEAFAAAGQ